MAIRREVLEINDFRESEEVITNVICPECESEDVHFADEAQPCDGTDLYNGLTYSICCKKCGHLFYEQEDLNTKLY